MSAPLRRNVPISLTLHDVNCAEALAALSAQWGFPIRLMDRATVLAKLTEPPGPEMLARAEPRFRRLEERADFRWEQIPLADVLRDIADRFAVSGHWLGGGIVLSAMDQPRPSRPPFGVAAFDNGWVRVYPRYISHTQTRSRWFIREFVEAEPSRASDQMMLCLTCEFPGEDADRLAGIRNCVAFDDCGRRLEARRVPDAWEFHSFADLGAIPDEWQGREMFPAPSPEARELVSVEGDLMVFEEFCPMRFEFSLPLTEAVREVGPVTVEITHFDPGEPLAEGTAGVGATRRPRGPSVEARIRKPAGCYLTSLGEYGQIQPVLVGASGNHYEREIAGSGICGRDDQVAEISAEFARADDDPAPRV